MGLMVSAARWRVIDNLLQSLDNSMEISELMSQKESPEQKKRVVEDSSSLE